MKLDQLDIDILNHLQEDGRMSLRELGKKLSTPHTTVYTRVERLKKKGVIKKFSAILHPHEAGGQIGLIIINAPPTQSKKIAEEISKHEEAKKIFRTFDGKIIVKAIVPEKPKHEGLEFFLAKLNGCPMDTYPIYEIIKYDHSIHDEILKKEF